MRPAPKDSPKSGTSPTTRKSGNIDTLLAPFAALPEAKREVLREVLQIYVSKDSGKHTELEKRKRLNTVINEFVKGSDEEDEEV
jgi:hypothetical protein